MTTNNRIFYANQVLLRFSRNGQNTSGTDDVMLGSAYYSSSLEIVSGIQSVSVSMSYPSDKLTDTGRFQSKTNNLYNTPKQNTYEITIERFISHPRSDSENQSLPFYKLDSGATYAAQHFLADSNLGCDESTLRNYDIVLAYGSDSASTTASATTKTSLFRGCLLSSLSYNFSVDGVLTETVTLTTNIVEEDKYTLPTATLNALASRVTGVVSKRNNVDIAGSILPEEANDLFSKSQRNSDGVPVTHTHADGSNIFGLQSIDIQVEIEYEKLNDIGKIRGSDEVSNEKYDNNKWAFVSLPISVKTTFTGMLRQIYPDQHLYLRDQQFVDNKQIMIVDQSSFSGVGTDSNDPYLIWDLGRKNYLEGVSISGGDTSGSNVEATLTYANQNSDYVVLSSATIPTPQLQAVHFNVKKKTDR